MWKNIFEANSFFQQFTDNLSNSYALCQEEPMHWQATFSIHKPHKEIVITLEAEDERRLLISLFPSFHYSQLKVFKYEADGETEAEKALFQHVAAALYESMKHAKIDCVISLEGLQEGVPDSEKYSTSFFEKIATGPNSKKIIGMLKKLPLHAGEGDHELSCDFLLDHICAVRWKLRPDPSVVITVQEESDDELEGTELLEFFDEQDIDWFLQQETAEKRQLAELENDLFNWMDTQKIKREKKQPPLFYKTLHNWQLAYEVRAFSNRYIFKELEHVLDFLKKDALYWHKWTQAKEEIREYLYQYDSASFIENRFYQAPAQYAKRVQILGVWALLQFRYEWEGPAHDPVFSGFVSFTSLYDLEQKETGETIEELLEKAKRVMEEWVKKNRLKSVTEGRKKNYMLKLINEFALVRGSIRKASAEDKQEATHLTGSEIESELACYYKNSPLTPQEMSGNFLQAGNLLIHKWKQSLVIEKDPDLFLAYFWKGEKESEQT